jgi:hypothetical protein
MEIELNFRLDGEGRTSNPNESQVEEGNEESQASVDYQSKAIMTSLEQPASDDDGAHQKLIDDLLFDAEISDCGLMPRTFWMPVDGTARCTFEQFALDVFHHHVPASLDYDKTKSGAEWWVQIRPSPEGTGRYSMHDDQPDAISETGISFHWDKDEDLRLLTGGSTYIHPHVSTVTYLTDYGCPTLALNCRVHNLTGDWMVPGDHPNDKEKQVEGFVSWPKTGKHTSFDGRYLHAALPDVMEPGAFEEQIKFTKSDDEKQNKLLKRRHRRVTFLVNIWLNYQPFEVKPFPETMIDKLSGTNEKDRKQLSLEHKGSDAESARNVTIKGGVASEEEEGSSLEAKERTYPLGDCTSDERLTAHIPLESIRKGAKPGGNVRIQWEKDVQAEGDSKPTFGLYKGPPIEEDPSTKTNDDAQKRASESQGESEDAKRQRQ